MTRLEAFRAMTEAEEVYRERKREVDEYWKHNHYDPVDYESEERAEVEKLFKKWEAATAEYIGFCK